MPCWGRHLRREQRASANGRAEQAGESPGPVLPFLSRKERRKPERNAQSTEHSHQPLLTKHIPRAAPGPDPGLGGASLRGPLPK